jgi:hypothetical protein
MPGVLRTDHGCDQSCQLAEPRHARLSRLLCLEQQQPGCPERNVRRRKLLRHIDAEIQGCAGPELSYSGHEPHRTNRVVTGRFRGPNHSSDCSFAVPCGRKRRRGTCPRPARDLARDAALGHPQGQPTRRPIVAHSSRPRSRRRSRCSRGRLPGRARVIPLPQAPKDRR